MPITLDDLRITTLKAWSARIFLDGFRYAGVDMLPSRTIGFLQPRSTASMTIQSFPSPAAGRPAFVDIVLGGSKSERFFTGLIDPKSVQSASETNTVNLVDLLGSLDRPFSSDLTWTNRPFINAVIDLLKAAGLSEDDVDSIYDPGAAFALGASYSITLTTVENISQAVRDLMNYGGTAIYVTPSGRIRVVDAPAIPSGSSQVVYARGADLSSGEFGIFDAQIAIEGNENVIVRFTATGPKRPDGAIPDGTFTATGLTGTAETVSYRFLQNDTTAQLIAERELVRRARARTNLRVTAPLNPLILPGDTVVFRDAKTGYPENTGALVLEVASSGVEMTMQLSLGPSLVEGEATSVQSPRVDFAMTVEQQLIELAGVPSERFFVQCQDQSTDPNGLEITARSWSATGPDVSPASSSDVAPLFFFSDLTGAEITLEVTSESGEAGTVTKKPKASQTVVFTRSLSAAAGADGWRVLASLEGWRIYDIAASCTAVPGVNDNGPLLAGFSNGEIYRSDDRLLTPPQLQATLNGSVGCLDVNEGDPTVVLAGHGTSLSRSLDGGVGFTLLQDFGETVYDAESSPANVNEIRVCTGNALRISFDGGTTWSTLLVGPLGSQARQVASAPWGHAVVFTGTSAVADAVQFEELYGIDWSGVAVDDQPTELTAITPLLDREGFLVADGDIHDLVRDGVLNAMTYGAATGTGRIYQLLWDGSQFVASLLTTTTDSETFKLTNLSAAYRIDTVSSVQVGYGDIVLPPPPPELILLPYLANGGADNFFHVMSDYTVTTIMPPVAGFHWRGIAIHPVNPSRWLVWGTLGTNANGSRLFYTANEGTTWIEVVLGIADPGNASADFFWIFDAVFTGVGANWAACLGWRDGTKFERRAYYFRGSGGVLSSTVNNSSDTGNLVWMQTLRRGLGEQVFGGGGTNSSSPFTVTGWYALDVVAGSTDLPTLVEADGWAASGLLRPGSSAAIGVQSTNIGYTAAYAAAAPDAVLSSGTSAISAESGVYVGGRQGVARIDGIDTDSPSTTVVSAAGINVQRIWTGGLRKAVATMESGGLGRIFAFTGDSWVTIDKPATATNLSDAIGVIERPT